MSDNPQARERLIGNERIKLTATLLNNLAGSCAFAGIIGPHCRRPLQLSDTRLALLGCLRAMLGPGRHHLPFHRAHSAERTDPMTFLEWYGLIAPFGLLGFGLIIFTIARADQRRVVLRIEEMKRQAS